MDQLSIIAVSIISIISIDYRLIDLNRCLPLFSGNCMEGIPSTNHRLNPDNLMDWSSASISIIYRLLNHWRIPQSNSSQFSRFWRGFAGIFKRDFQDFRRIFFLSPSWFSRIFNGFFCGFRQDFTGSLPFLWDISTQLQVQFYGDFYGIFMGFFLRNWNCFHVLKADLKLESINKSWEYS